MNWFELSVKSRANESVPVSLPTIYFLSRNDGLVEVPRIDIGVSISMFNIIHN